MSTKATPALAGGKATNLATLARAGFPVPAAFVVTTEGASDEDVVVAYRELGGGPVAVRSSATAEDLADLSFAGQQDTFLDVVGEEALLDAVGRCRASIGTERAVRYRDRHGVGAEAAAAVIVQRMVVPEAAGVAFTANPLSGRRDELVVEAVAGLGDAVSAGRVEPDRYLVSGGVVVERTGEVLGDARILELAALASRVAAAFGAPQDVEWALAGGSFWLLQSRPITALFPLPDPVRGAEGLRVYVSEDAGQGISVFTPLGLDVWVRVVDGGGTMPFMSAKRPPLRMTVKAGGRIFRDMTDVVRDSRLRRLWLSWSGTKDPTTSATVGRLIEEGRFAPRRQLTVRNVLTVLPTLIPPLTCLACGLVAPESMRRRQLRVAHGRVEQAQRHAREAPTPAALLDSLARDAGAIPRNIFVTVGSLLWSGHTCTRLLKSLLPKWAGPGTPPTVTLELMRGLPGNVTTEMNHELWRIAQAIRADPGARAQVDDFVRRYGFRAVSEIDLGTPRWHEDPAPVHQALESYLALEDPALAPDAIFARSAAEAERLASELVDRVRQRRGRVRARITASLIRRMRLLLGLREWPKFEEIQIFDAYRTALLAYGRALVAEGRLAEPDDVFYVSLDVLRRAAGGEDVGLKAVARAGRADYARERARAQVPRVLLSSGETFYQGVVDESEADLLGDPVSPGVGEGRVRVIHDPHGTRLEPGEVLVCPNADPAWTPLFLVASGVVMEIGGMTSHGSVVARESGIPAVSSVQYATRRLVTGQRVRVDGNRGRVTILD